jgi:hypothetical protein
MKFYMDRALQDPINKDTKTMKYPIGASATSREGYTKPDTIRVLPDLVRPDNVFRFANAGASKDNHIKHPAPFNKELPSYYINLLTDEGDVVLDPFSGIATTGMSCLELNRFYIGYELNETYCDFSIKRLQGDTDDFYCVNQYSLDDEFIKSYPNRSAAKRDNPDISEENIIRCYNGWYKSAGGYKWKLEKRQNYVKQVSHTGELIKVHTINECIDFIKSNGYPSFNKMKYEYKINKGTENKLCGFIWTVE